MKNDTNMSLTPPSSAGTSSERQHTMRISNFFFSGPEILIAGVFMASASVRMSTHITTEPCDSSESSFSSVRFSTGTSLPGWLNAVH